MLDLIKNGWRASGFYLEAQTHEQLLNNDFTNEVVCTRVKLEIKCCWVFLNFTSFVLFNIIHKYIYKIC